MAGRYRWGRLACFRRRRLRLIGKWVLLFERHHPYTYLLPFYAFPERVSAVNLKTGTAKQLADKPLEDNLPKYS